MNPSCPLTHATLQATIVALCARQGAIDLLLIQARTALTSAAVTGTPTYAVEWTLYNVKIHSCSRLPIKS